MTSEELQLREQEIDDLCIKLYEESQRTFTPLFPFVFIRVLTKEQVQNGIILPGIEQNKPVHEGIVLATWGEKIFEHRKVMDDGTRYTKQTVLRSQFVQGDHVCIPHWAGAPVHGFSDKHYRVVKEWEWDFSKDGGIFCTVNRIAPDEAPRGILSDMLREMLGTFVQSIPERVIEATAHRIEDRLVLLDREQHSVTLSGR
jgi:co-chaperonin GroES (HSP10)